MENGRAYRSEESVGYTQKEEGIQLVRSQFSGFESSKKIQNPLLGGTFGSFSPPLGDYRRCPLSEDSKKACLYPV